MTLEWKDPPAFQGGRRSGVDHAATATELKANPGQWAKIRETATRGPATQLAVFIGQGRYTAYRPPGAFEAACRSNGDGTFATYARYVGGPS